MTKTYLYLLAAFLTYALIFTSCSNNDDNPVSPDPISGRTYSLDQKITNRRECHALKDIANDALNLKFHQIIFEYVCWMPVPWRVYSMTISTTTTGIMMAVNRLS